ncbi:HEL339Cp [Eremothecium sinecaudum]|uniref:HEL339Cp n=1 Tax=Eremothecium sinecaudum TaxID=45286 RepID=A0A109UZ82_9SACH|nr:HEL339Cp [Eremothecium sinecaudum]AMD20942.1 HEL339Cp [Eremothecium sinecaudum]
MEDRLQQLDAMKRKLQELRERRPIVVSAISSPVSMDTKKRITSNDDFVSHLLNNIQTPKNSQDTGSVDLISVGVQTDNMVEGEEIKETLEQHGITNTTTITYEKAVQTDDIELVPLYAETIDRSPEPPKSSAEDAIKLEEEEELASVVNEIEYRKLKPLVITSQNISLETTTFALIEALENKRSLINAHQMEGNTFSIFSHELQLDIIQGMNPLCASIDFYQGFVLVLVHWESKVQHYNTQTACYVVSFETGEIVDTVHFQGQTLIRGEFVRVKDSKILTMLLTSYNGKTILYELRTVASKSSGKTSGPPKLERNVISRNYHNWPVYAMWQYHVRDSKVLSASTDGTIHELNLIDLKPVTDPTSWNAVKVIPWSRSELILKEPTGNLKFIEQLSRLSLYDEVTIKAICTFHNDPSSIYLGCEDGGIYKIVTEKGEGPRNIKVALDNNGFIPIAASDNEGYVSANQDNDSEFDEDLEQGPLFHVGPITALFPCKDLQGLMVSCSMDWKCVLWDVPNNIKLLTVELESAVISGELATFSAESGVHHLALLTAFEFHIYELNLTSTHTYLGSIKWSVPSAPKLVLSIPVTQSKHGYNMFSYFKLVQQHESWYAILGGEGSKLECYRIFS